MLSAFNAKVHLPRFVGQGYRVSGCILLSREIAEQIATARTLALSHRLQGKTPRNQFRRNI
jgi:hypothetical protein